LDAPADQLDHIRLRPVRAQLVFLHELGVLGEARGKHVRIGDERKLTPSGDRHEAASLDQKRRDQKDKPSGLLVIPGHS
jgi:hypothetical protein